MLFDGAPNDVTQRPSSPFSRRLVLPDEEFLTEAQKKAWADAPEGVLALDRGDQFRCTVNMGAEPVRLDIPGDLLLASGPVTIEDGVVTLPPDTTVWWSR